MLPPNVHEKHGSWYHVSRKNGKKRWIKLCRVADGEATLYQSLADLKHRPAGTMSELFDQYAAEILPTKAPATQKSYLFWIEKRLRPFFGSAPPSQIKPKHVAQFLAAGGDVAANRAKATLSDVFTFALRRGMVDSNPCHGVRRNPEAPRDTYVTDENLSAVWEIAPVGVRTAMVIAYLTGLRQGDILRLTTAQIAPDGIKCTEGKTGRPRHFKWSERLLEAVREGLAHGDGVHIVCNTRKRPYTSSGFQTTWQKLMAGRQDRFTFHDIRAKAASDSAHGRELLAHASEALFKRVYKRKADAVRPTW